MKNLPFLLVVLLLAACGGTEPTNLPTNEAVGEETPIIAPTIEETATAEATATAAATAVPPTPIESADLVENTEEPADSTAAAKTPEMSEEELQAAIDNENSAAYPSDVFSFFDKWRITLGDGETIDELLNYRHEDYFYTANDGTDWVVYKSPNSGGTTPNSSNTRAELRQLSEWTPETEALMTGTLKVMHVSTTGDARVPAAFSVVIGQIHGAEGHKNEPLKIFYKKFPGHSKGSVFWNYEINTAGDDNGERWDYSTAVWGYDWSVVGDSPTSYPEEPTDGIELGEEFRYEVHVVDGVMSLTFSREGHETKTFSKSLVSSDYTKSSDIPQQVLTVFESTGQDGTERANAYAGELQYFKQGSYNQTNGKDPSENMVWNTGAETYGGDLAEQYANGSYAEVWFREASIRLNLDTNE